jgi:hypothetical protein
MVTDILSCNAQKFLAHRSDSSDTFIAMCSFLVVNIVSSFLLFRWNSAQPSRVALFFGELQARFPALRPNLYCIA